MAEYSYAFRFAVSDEFECLRLLLDAGALEAVVVQVGKPRAFRSTTRVDVVSPCACSKRPRNCLLYKDDSAAARATPRGTSPPGLSDRVRHTALQCGLSTCFRYRLKQTDPDDGQVEAMRTSDDSAERAAATLERSRGI